MALNRRTPLHELMQAIRLVPDILANPSGNLGLPRSGMMDKLQGGAPADAVRSAPAAAVPELPEIRFRA